MPSVNIQTSSSGQTALVAAPGAGRVIRVFGFSLSANGNTNVKFQSASTDKAGPYYMTQYSYAQRGDPFTPLFDCAANEALNINNSAAVAIGGELNYTIIGAQTS